MGRLAFVVDCFYNFINNSLVERLSTVIYMFTKHFVRGLVTFTGMILLGLIGVFLMNYFIEAGGLKTPESVEEVAE